MQARVNNTVQHMLNNMKNNYKHCSKREQKSCPNMIRMCTSIIRMPCDQQERKSLWTKFRVCVTTAAEYVNMRRMLGEHYSQPRHCPQVRGAQVRQRVWLPLSNFLVRLLNSLTFQKPNHILFATCMKCHMTFCNHSLRFLANSVFMI